MAAHAILTACQLVNRTKQRIRVFFSDCMQVRYLFFSGFFLFFYDPRGIHIYYILLNVYGMHIAHTNTFYGTDGHELCFICISVEFAQSLTTAHARHLKIAPNPYRRIFRQRSHTFLRLIVASVAGVKYDVSRTAHEI